MAEIVDTYLIDKVEVTQLRDPDGLVRFSGAECEWVTQLTRQNLFLALLGRAQDLITEDFEIRGIGRSRNAVMLRNEHHYALAVSIEYELGGELKTEKISVSLPEIVSSFDTRALGGAITRGIGCDEITTAFVGRARKHIISFINDCAALSVRGAGETLGPIGNPSMRVRVEMSEPDRGYIFDDEVPFIGLKNPKVHVEGTQ